jgi:hypothetical protein
MLPQGLWASCIRGKRSFLITLATINISPSGAINNNFRLQSLKCRTDFAVITDVQGFMV